MLIVIAGLLVGADFGLAAFAEHEISQKAREQLGLADDPSVSVHGFPFTTQALSGHYDLIDVYAGGVSVKELHDLELAASLHDVDAPLSDVLNGNVKAIRIGELEGSVRVKASDVNRVGPLTNVEDLRIEPSTVQYVQTGRDTMTAEQKKLESKTDKPSTGIRLSGYVQIGGQKVEIFCFAMIDLVGNSIVITPHRLQYGNDKKTTIVPQEVQEALLPDFKATINAGNLPFTITPTAVHVDSGSVVIKGKAQNVTFTGAPEPAPSPSVSR